VSRRRPRILIRGAGLAGITAAKLLHDRGADVRVAAAPRRPGRIVAIPIETLRLAADLFGIDVAALRIGPMVDRRRVDWSEGRAGAVAQVALVCDVADFAATLARPLRDAGCLARTADDDVDWTLECSGRPARGALRAGERVGQFARIVGMAHDATTAVTAMSAGWIFTAPHPAGGLAVLLVSPSAAVCAASADHMAERLAEAGYAVPGRDVADLGQPESIAPALAQPPHDDDRLRVGDAALALDPLRGDGAGFALRGALLAQAVLAAAERGEDRARCLAHYARRLRGVFASHLHGCVSHYGAARHAEIWRHEVDAMGALARRLAVDPARFGFRMEGHDLVAMPAGTQPRATM
jgi:2-polyprenyl-6-methoxyphenol hydroxylase-like FAD-dependent oxidoreductase